MMKITVFNALKSDGTYSKDWHWNARNSGKIVSSAGGYDQARYAVDAAVRHADQWCKVATGVGLSKFQKDLLKLKIVVKRLPKV